MKRLSELDPIWVGLLRPSRGGGLSFDCPNCGPKHRLAVYFSNPIDGLPAAPWQTPTWLREGSEFDTLTLAPSLLYPCFHGWVEDGKVIDTTESPASAQVDLNGTRQQVALSPKQYQSVLALSKKGVAP